MLNPGRRPLTAQANFALAFFRNMFLSMALLCGLTGFAQSTKGSVKATYMPDQLIIRLREGIIPVQSHQKGLEQLGVAGLDAVLSKYHCTTATRLNATKTNTRQAYTYVLRFAGPVDIAAAIAEFSATGLVKYAEPDYLASNEATTPNDPYFQYSWSLFNNGTFAYSTPVVSGADMDMKLAWDITQGSSSVVVSVIDAGAKLDHPEFAGRIWTNPGEIIGNGIDDDANGFIDDYRGWNFVSNNNNPTDDNSHGTNVAGIIGATGNNGIGYAGVDWNCKLMILKTQNSTGSGSYSAIVAAIAYSTDNGAHVINMSLGGSASSAAMQDAIDDAYAAGINVVCAMGNDNTSALFFPAACNHVIAVGASTAADTRASFSNYGSHITVIAPGNVIFGLWYLSNTDYGHAMSGTSMASPAVAGVVSLLLAQNPSRTPDQIRTILQTTSDDLVGNPAEDIAGFDNYFGYGRVNAYRALTACGTPTVNPITGTASGCIGTTLTLTQTTTGGTWSSSNTAVATIGTSGIVTTLTAGTTTIAYSKTNSCGTGIATRIVTVHPFPTTISGTATICEGSTTTLTSTPTGGTWASSNAAKATVNATTGVVAGIDDGTATITYQTSAGCTTTKTVTINVKPATITGTPTACIGNSTTLATATTGGTWTSSNAARASVNAATGVVTGVTAGTATITYNLATGCNNTTTATVIAAVAAITGTTNVCTGSLVTLGNTTAGGTWSSSNITKATVNSATGQATGIAAGTTTISYIVSASCFKATTLTVNALPAAITGTAAVCVGLTTTLASATAGGTWSSSTLPKATVVAATGVTTGVAAGTSTITYKVTSTGCYAVKEVTVNSAPAAITGTLSVCAAATTTLSATPGGGNWTSGNTAIATVNAATGAVTGIGAGTVNITYTGTNSCIKTAVVTVNALPVAITGTAAVCTGSNTTLAATPTGGTWSSSNLAKSTIATTTGIASGISAGTATITYRLATGCIRTRELTVNATPATITGTMSVCAGSTTTLVSTPTGGVWSSSIPTRATVNAASGAVNGISAGTSVITYTSGTCFKTAIVTVNALPTAITGTTSVCEGLTTTLVSTPAGGVWSSSNIAKATVSAGIVRGIDAGTSVIKYQLTTGCNRTVTVSVNNSPDAITGTASMCAAATTTLSATPTGGTWSSSLPATASVNVTTGIVSGINAGTVNITYALGTCVKTKIATINALPAVIAGTASVCTGSTTALTSSPAGGTWSSSNVAKATVVLSTGVTSGVSAGTALITYKLATGCQRTTTVSVNTAPAAITGTLSVCIGSNTTLNATPGGGVWSSSLPTRATINSATGVVNGISAGTAVISYTLGSCFKTAIVIVNALPTTITGVATVCEGLTTTLASTPAGGTWSSSNLAKATLSAGIIRGIDAGTATITYQLATGCRQTTTVTVNNTPSAIGGTAAVCIGNTTTLNTTPGGGAWSSSVPTRASVNSGTGVVNGLTAGTTVVTYTLTGCTATRIVTVNSLPAAITGTTNICATNATTLAATPAGGTWSSSNAVSATVGSTTGLVMGITTGTTTISYVLPTGCASSATVSVNAAPAANTGYALLCIGQPVSVTLLGNAVAGGTWTSSNAARVVTSTAGLMKGMSLGTAVVTYRHPSGCYSTTEVTVNAAVANITGTTNVCVSSTVLLANTTSAGTWSSSNAGVATINSATGSLVGIAAGTANVTYQVSLGCYKTRTQTVMSVPAPITGTTSAVVGATTALSCSPAGGAWASSNMSVATVNASTGLVKGLSTGVTTISYTLTTGCRATTDVTILSAKPSFGEEGPAIDQPRTPFTIYPNPTSGLITIASSVTGVFVLYTIDGKIAIQVPVENDHTEITLPNTLSAGVYMYRFVGTDGTNEVGRLVYQP
jgi:subtilisin family serine protease/uncharacterized protein YjdB